MLPEFDEHGNLPPGIYRTTFNEVVKRFGGLKSLKRQQLIRSLEDFYNLVRGDVIRIYIDGSFVTSKLSPSDVDLLIILPSDFDFTSLAAKTIKRYQLNKKTYLLHIFVFFQKIQEQDIQKWLKLFTEDREHNAKGIIYLEEGQ